MNFLILSCGTRNKIVQYFKTTFSDKGKVFATDCNFLAPALYDSDNYYILPKIDDISYIDLVINLCTKLKINGVLSLIDPELSLLAFHEEKFLSIGTKVIGSSYEVCERSLDKWQMYLWLKNNGFACAKTYFDLFSFQKALSKNEIKFPIFIKPAKGSASISIQKVASPASLDYLFKENKDLLIQEFLDCQEIGVDCYIDIISKKVVSIFAKKKILMRAGETDKSVSYKDAKLFDFVIAFVEQCGFLGPIDIDIFDFNGIFIVSEVNPRFGGGYPHAYECGVDHIQYIANNLESKINTSNIGNYKEGIYMMKYNEVKIKRF